ncbi:MAG: SDR family oxidoreductase [Ruminococcaceae bacterium]|nr:SDR family oxidoreductase [Oscillospiraceae bacterium]
MKTAVITGGSGAIGSGLVEEFSKDHRVVFTYLNNREKAVSIAERYGAEAVRCDQTNDLDIKKLLDTVNSCDLLINNAGIGSVGLFTDISYQEMYKVINTDLLGVMSVTKSVLPLMIRKKSGCIINISSIWGVYGGSCEVVYSAAKAGIIGFTKALSKETGCSGVRVNCIAPGFIESEMNAHLSKEEIEEFVSSTSLGKTGTARDVALAARYLSDSEFVTGQVLGVDGGFWG